MNINYTTQFKKDFKRAKKQNRDILKLQSIIKNLTAKTSLGTKFKDHQLVGNWNKHRECHIEPDWLLIYRITGDDLFLERTGSHSDLFKK